MTGWEDIGDGVWTRRYESLSLRAGVVAGHGGVLVVDTRSHAGEAAELAGHVEELGAGPVRWAVNTHHHWDHTFGNATFAPVPIWGHVDCAARLRLDGERMKADAVRYLPDAAAAIEAVVVEPPRHTFADATVLDLGSRFVELRHLGLGHTDNDAVVVVPDARVVFAGDLVEQGAPPVFGDAYPLDWPATLDRVLELVGGPVVPGHGDVVDRGFVAAQRNAIAAAVAIARDRHAQGRPAAGDPPVDAPFPDGTMREVFRRVAWQLDGARA